jgi:hypothetical protein
MPPFHRNPQYNNVGNRGDILKHGVLVRLLGEIIRSAPKRVAYVDPYAFIPAWPCAVRSWVHEADALVKARPGLAEYQRLEHAELRNGRPYLCSVGIARKLLADLGPHLLLAEREPFERAVLREELEASAVIEDNASSLGGRLKALLADEEVVVALVDPFRFDAEAEGVLRAILEAVGERPWAAVLFDYSEHGVAGFTKALTSQRLWALSEKRVKSTASNDEGTQKAKKKTVFYHLGLTGTAAGLEDAAAACRMVLAPRANLVV